MVHAAFLDKDYCLVREKFKYETALQMPMSDRSKGFNAHIFDYPALLKSGKICKLARGVYDNSTGNGYAVGAMLEKIPDTVAKAIV